MCIRDRPRCPLSNRYETISATDVLELSDDDGVERSAIEIATNKVGKAPK